MPDFFEPGEPWPVDKFPPQGEDKKKLQEFFGGLAKPADAVAKLINVARTLKSEGVEFVGAYGFCWGSFVLYCPRFAWRSHREHRGQGYHPCWICEFDPSGRCLGRPPCVSSSCPCVSTLC